MAAVFVAVVSLVLAVLCAAAIGPTRSGNEAPPDND
jgi:hypothetical protein